MHTRDRFFRRWCPGGHFHQQRIVGAGNHGTRIGRTRIEPHAEPSRTSIGRKAAIVRDEIISRVFSGDTALQRVSIQMNVRLLRHAAGRVADARTCGNANLRLHQINARDHFGHRVFHLYARIDFDKIKFAGIGVLQELHRTGVAVLGRSANLQRSCAQLGAL